ncbi:UBAP1-MVB12-associated (UMA)-domain containing protein 1 isoform X2 [Dromiciops gliroides]|uniref:UBAP1-MVB12-associated (UMA)-domain containing protein 1 isoform X2 n=1 Tax=Dromiciops gliroides TaxID=33562 RepID=UPI001CC7B5C3|nr:UBAP1-MVB12-associated (UMA)-domain containing protein 1 isoform X2 [Dromiciops gliroides]
MFHFFRKTPEPKKVPVVEREADGFVLLGDTANEQKAVPQDGPSEEAKQPSEVRGAPSRLAFGNEPSQKADVGDQPCGSGSDPPKAVEDQTLENNTLASELLRDVPFTLAPHVLAVQGTISDLPNHLLTSALNDNLSRFWSWRH